METRDDQKPATPGGKTFDDALTPEDVAEVDAMDRMVDEHLRQARDAGPVDPPPLPVKYDLQAIAESYLSTLTPRGRALVLEETLRLQERLWQMEWYAEKARCSGGRSWLDLARSYRIHG